MPVSEIVGMAVAKSSSKAVAKSAEGLLTRLLGPAADELGLTLGDIAKRFRARKFVEALANAQKMLDAASIVPGPVRLGTLVPLLQGASLEDDVNLASMWAGLIATAGSSQAEEAQHPSYARILSEITPREAHMLENLSRLGGTAHWPSLRKSWAAEFGVSEMSMSSSWGNLNRLGLLGNTHGREGELVGALVVTINQYGHSFLAAVRGPAPTALRRLLDRTNRNHAHHASPQQRRLKLGH